MSMFDNLVENEKSLNDKDIASDMLKDSKFGISSLSKATLEAVNPQLRNILDSQLTSAVGEHHRLSDIMVNKGWYPAYDDPQQLLKKDAKEAQSIIR